MVADRLCFACKASADVDAKDQQSRRDHPERFHGLHRVFEDAD